MNICLTYNEKTFIVLTFLLFILLITSFYYALNYQIFNGRPFTKFYETNIKNSTMQIIYTKDYGIEYLFGGDILTCATIISNNTIPINQNTFYDVSAKKVFILSDDKLYAGICEITVSKENKQ
jgi:hypothetical protein